MLTGEIRNQVDRIWDAFWSGGISNPLEVIEQITYLLFLRRLDEQQQLEENKATRLSTPIERRVFPEGNDPRGRPYADLRWSRFKNLAAAEMYTVVGEHVFPFLRTLGGDGSTYAHHMKDARFTIPTPALLAKVVDLIDQVPMTDRDTKGDIYEYMLGKIASAGQNGQFRTPRHIIRLMVELTAPGSKDLTGARDVTSSTVPRSEADVREVTAAILHDEVAAMNLDNFVVRPRRRLVEKYGESKVWAELSASDRAELGSEVAGLPSEQPAEPEEIRRFDLLMLNLQLSLLRAQPAAFTRLQDQVKVIASLLEDKASIPMVRSQLSLIAEVQTDEWWQNVTVAMLETVRIRLRSLASLVEKCQRTPIYSDFEDDLGAEAEVALPAFGAPGAFPKFRAKAQAFLRQHDNHVAIRKLRMNKPLTAADLDELERMLAESGGGPEDIEHARGVAEGLGLFVRSLVGLDRQAAKEALAGFLEMRTFTASQIEFVNLIVEHLTAHGVMAPAMLYESPFTDITPQGPEGIFNEAQVNELVAVLERVRATATVG